MPNARRLKRWFWVHKWSSLVCTLFMLLLCVTGLPFGTVRRDCTPCTQWLDLHNLLGIVTLVWLFVVAATGVINTLSIPIFHHWQSTQLAEMIDPYRGRPPIERTVSLDRIVDAAAAAGPDMALSFLAFPGNDFAGPHHFAASSCRARRRGPPSCSSRC